MERELRRIVTRADPDRVTLPAYQFQLRALLLSKPKVDMMIHGDPPEQAYKLLSMSGLRSDVKGDRVHIVGQLVNAFGRDCVELLIVLICDVLTDRTVRSFQGCLDWRIRKMLGFPTKPQRVLRKRFPRDLKQAVEVLQRGHL